MTSKKKSTDVRVIGSGRLKIEHPTPSGKLNIILYGPSGAGKTWLAGTACDCEETSPPLLIDIDSGTSTLSGRNIDMVRPRSWREIQEIYDFLLNDNEEYKCVIIDSLTETQKKFSMGTVLNEIADVDGEDSYNDLGRTVVPTRQDWMRSGDQMRKLIRAFRDLAYLRDEERRVHVIMVALERYDEKSKVFAPSLSGSLGLECGAFVDILARLSRQNAVEIVDEDGVEMQESVIHRHLLTDDYINEDGVRYMAKDRTGRLGSQLWDPTIEQIINGVGVQ